MKRCILLVLVVWADLARAGDTAPLHLFAKGLDAFKTPHGEWKEAESVTLDAANPRRLAFKEGCGIWVNGAKGRTANLYTKDKHGDLAVHLEFLMAKGSNSGIKFHGHYEIQLADSFGKKDVTASDCGGVYPRAEATPAYHHIDKGIPPMSNACKAPGEWQSLDIVFRAPRFDDQKKKTAHARLEKVTLNGVVIHDNVELLTPTGDRWRGPEMSEGPLMLQADHGPVAFRNLSVQMPARESK
jgi:3-keto-disaccharide hydrolase